MIYNIKFATCEEICINISTRITNDLPQILEEILREVDKVTSMSYDFG